MNTARVPPSDMGAERQILGSAMLDEGCRKELQEMLLITDFYSDAHGRIWAAIVAAAKQGHGVDVIGIRGQLGSKLESIGGDEYLMALTDVIPTVAQATKHAARIQKLATVRAHIARGHEIAASGYAAAEGDLDEWLDATERIEMPTRRGATQAMAYSEVINQTYDGIREQANSGSKLAGLAFGIRAYDDHTLGHSKGHLVILAGRPGMGKSALVGGAIDHAAQEGVVCAVFSLEMTFEQWGRRHLSGESGIDGRRLRAAHTLDRNDWPRLSNAAGALSDLPIHFWDKPGTSINELRSECRRIDREEKRKGNEDGLGLVVIDYIQLLRVAGRARSREEEVSQLSRELKELAKELMLPVIALAQLNRKCEERTDKRPMLSDLRECLVGSTRIPDAVTGELRTIESGLMNVVSMTECLRFRGAKCSQSWSTGTKPTIILTTNSGRRIHCTKNHPLRTIDGWTKAGNLAIGTRVATARKIPEPTHPTNRFTHDEMRLLGYLIADGSYLKHRSVEYVNASDELRADAIAIVRKRFGITATERDAHGTSVQVAFTVRGGAGPHGNPLIEWLREIGIHGSRGETKRLPNGTFGCNNRRLASLLGTLWAGDGTVSERRLKYSSTSPGLLDDICWIMMRLGIIFSRTPMRMHQKSKVPVGDIIVADYRQICRFRTLVKIPGRKGAALASIGPRGNNSHIDRLPIEVTEQVAYLRKAAGMSHADLGYRTQGKEMCRPDLLAVSERLGCSRLRDLAESDLLWDKVVGVEDGGMAEVFDATVPSLSNFVADGFVVHNSGAIEQDADTIVFVYRDEVYNPFDDDAVPPMKDLRRVAELIFAKNREGGIGAVLAAWIPELTKFADLEERYGNSNDGAPTDWHDQQP